jgi:AcrR family transcriptional regulator
MATRAGRPAGAPTSERGERARRAILDAALPAFGRDGYAAASLNQIIDASGLTKGGFYFHFPSKQALALAVVADHQQRWISRIDAEISQYDKAVDRLFAASRLIARYAKQGEGPATLSKLVEELARDPGLRDEVCGSIRAWLDTVTEHFAAAQAEGAVRADLDPAMLAQVAVGGFIGAQAISEQVRDGRFLDRIEALVQVVQLATQEGGRS